MPQNFLIRFPSKIVACDFGISSSFLGTDDSEINRAQIGESGTAAFMDPRVWILKLKIL